MPTEINTPLEEVYAHYFQTYYSKLWRYAMNILSRNIGHTDPERAHEAVQEAFMVAWQKPKEFLESPSPVGWLVTTQKNVLRNMIREDQRWTARLQQFQDSLDVNAVQSAPGADLELEGFIPQEELELLKRLYINRVTYEELCQELGIKKSTLAMRIKKSKADFRNAYTESENSSRLDHLNRKGGSK